MYVKSLCVCVCVCVCVGGHVQLIVVTFGDFQVTPVIHLVCLVTLLDRLKIVSQITRVN